MLNCWWPALALSGITFPCLLLPARCAASDWYWNSRWLRSRMVCPVHERTSLSVFTNLVQNSCNRQAINLPPGGGLCYFYPLYRWLQHSCFINHSGMYANGLNIQWVGYRVPYMQHNLVFMPWLLRFFHSSCHLHWKSSSPCWRKSGRVMENCTSRLKQWKQWLRGKITVRVLAFQSLMALSLPGVGCKWFASVLQSLRHQSKPFLTLSLAMRRNRYRGAHAASSEHAETVGQLNHVAEQLHKPHMTLWAEIRKEGLNAMWSSCYVPSIRFCSNTDALDFWLRCKEIWYAIGKTAVTHLISSLLWIILLGVPVVSAANHWTLWGLEWCRWHKTFKSW